MTYKILVADDEEVIQTVIKRALEDPAYQMLSAHDGLETLELAQKETPALVLLDVNMPIMSGREVLRALRRNIQTQAIPVIVVSGCAEAHERISGLELGADDYITKPFEVGELKARVDSMLRRHRRDLSANPLTRLPGSPVIEEEVNKRIRENADFAFFYVDIDNFKAYNDVYGYSQGDRVIQHTAGLLLESLKDGVGYGDFLGHIGGDDFVVITRPASATDVAKTIAEKFDAELFQFYKQEDLDRGHLSAKDRLGHERKFPLMTLSIAITATGLRRLDHYGRVVDIVTEIKKFLKSQPREKGSRFLVDRRRDDAPPA